MEGVVVIKKCNFSPTKCGNFVCRFKEEQRLRVFENRVLRKISGAKKDEVTGGGRRLHNEELHNLNSALPDKKKPRMGWAERETRMGERKNAYRFRSEK